MGRRVVSRTEEFDAERVRPLPGQPRKRFYGIAELAASIKEVGQSTPGIVTLVKDDPKFDAQLIDGERRLRACKMLGVPFRAEVRTEKVDDAFAASFAANFGKQEHTPLEIAEALHRLSERYTREQMAAMAGKTDGWVGHHLSLLKLHPDVQAMIEPDEEGNTALPYTVAMILTAVDPERQVVMARKIAKAGMSMAAARRMILREDPDLYLEKAAGKRRIKLERIEGIVADMADKVGLYLDMPKSQLEILIDEADPVLRRRIIEDLRREAQNLDDLAEAIEERMKLKLRPRRAG